VRDRLAVVDGRVGQQRVEVDLGQLPLLRAVEQPRLQHPDHPAPAQRRQLLRDLAAEALGRLEPHQHDLHRPDAHCLRTFALP
jgi:hypothetical protein